MSEPQFDDIAALWKQEPDAEERRTFEALARRTGWRARLLRYLDIGLALFVLIGVLLALLWDRGPATVALVLLCIVAIVWSNWKRHKLRQVALALDTSNREAFVATAMESVRARLRSSSMWIVLLLPSVALGLALIAAATKPPTLGWFLGDVVRRFTSPSGVAWAVFLALLIIYFGMVNLRLRRELERLKSLENQYREEAARDLEG